MARNLAGGSRVLVDIPEAANETEAGRAAFLVKRTGNPRISSVEFADFCIDGMHFSDASNDDPENSYRNGKTGIHIASANDSFRITGMGMVYLEHGVVSYHADASTIDSNFIAECGNCIELKGMGQASKISNNLIGAGYNGYSIYAENFGGLLVSGNNVFPRGRSSIEFSGVVRSSITANRLHSFYPGMLVLSGNCSENLIASNHFLRDHEPWAPMARYDNGLDDQFGLLHLNGDNNSVIANHISESIDTRFLKPASEKPVIIRIVSGTGNYVANNHIVATTESTRAKRCAERRLFCDAGRGNSLNEKPGCPRRDRREGRAGVQPEHDSGFRQRCASAGGQIGECVPRHSRAGAGDVEFRHALMSNRGLSCH